jgi:hypothetical protein
MAPLSLHFGTPHDGHSSCAPCDTDRAVDELILPTYVCGQVCEAVLAAHGPLASCDLWAKWTVNLPVGWAGCMRIAFRSSAQAKIEGKLQSERHCRQV